MCFMIIDHCQYDNAPGYVLLSFCNGIRNSSIILPYGPHYQIGECTYRGAEPDKCLLTLATGWRPQQQLRYLFASIRLKKLLKTTNNKLPQVYKIVHVFFVQTLKIENCRSGYTAHIGTRKRWNLLINHSFLNSISDSYTCPSLARFEQLL